MVSNCVNVDEHAVMTSCDRMDECYTVLPDFLKMFL